MLLCGNRFDWNNGLVQLLEVSVRTLRVLYERNVSLMDCIKMRISSGAGVEWVATFTNDLYPTPSSKFGPQTQAFIQHRRELELAAENKAQAQLRAQSKIKKDRGGAQPHGGGGGGGGTTGNGGAPRGDSKHGGTRKGAAGN